MCIRDRLYRESGLLWLVVSCEGACSLVQVVFCSSLSQVCSTMKVYRLVSGLLWSVTRVVFPDGLMSTVLLYHTWSFLMVWCLRFSCIIHVFSGLMSEVLLYHTYAFTIPLQTNHSHFLKTFSKSWQLLMEPTVTPLKWVLSVPRSECMSSPNKLFQQWWSNNSVWKQYGSRLNLQLTNFWFSTAYARALRRQTGWLLQAIPETVHFFPVEIVILLSIGNNGLQSYHTVSNTHLTLPTKVNV